METQRSILSSSSIDDNNGSKHLTLFLKGNNCKDFKTLLLLEFGRETKEAAG